MPKYTDDEAKRCIEERIVITDRAWSSKHELFNEIYSVYRFWTDTETEVELGERANIFIPIAFSVIETKVPRIIQSLLGLDPFFKAEGRNKKDHPNAEFVSMLMQYQLKDEINAFFPLLMWWKECMMYGNSYKSVRWEKEEVERKRRFPQYWADEVVGYDFKTVKETVYDGIVFDHLDIFDCFPAPFGVRINGRINERMPYFILRSEPTGQHLKNLMDKKILDPTSTKKVLDSFPQGCGDLDKTRRDRMIYNKMTSTEFTDKHAPKYVMYTMFEHDWWVSYINGHVIRNKENPYGDNKIPVVAAFDTPVPHEHFCIGQIEPIIKLNYYANDLENLNLDFYMKDINPGGFVDINKLGDAGAARFSDYPEEIYHVTGDPNTVYAPVRRSGTSAIRSETERINIERLIDKTLGQSDVSRGVSRKGEDTATEIVALIRESNFRFDLSIKLLKNESLAPLLDMMLERNQQFFPELAEKEILKYTEGGEVDFRNINLSQILGNFRFRINTNPLQGNSFAYAQTLIKYLDIVNASQGRYPKLVQEIGKYLQIDNIENLIDDPINEVLAMILQAQREGLIGNAKQAALLLAKTIDILAPPGSPQAKAVASQLPMPKNEVAAIEGMERGLRNV